jgi:hypothetical protein
MYHSYILRFLMSYFVVIGGLMHLRPQVFLSQLKALAADPTLIFSLGFFALILGIGLLMVKHLSWLGKLFGLLVLIKGMVCVAFPLEFCEWILKITNLEFVKMYALVLLGLGVFFGIWYRISNTRLEH